MFEEQKPKTMDPLTIASAAGSIINPIAQMLQNKSNQKFAEKQYATQRTDALADWTRTNDYNHPSAQMQRLREAGLNANLVYGKGADNTSAMVRSSSAQSPTTQAPRVDTGAINQSILTRNNLALGQAQTDNLRKQNTILDQQNLELMAKIKNIDAQTAETLARIPTYQSQMNKQKVDTDMATFQYNMAQSLRQNSLDYASEKLRGEQISNQNALTQMELNVAQNSSSLQEARARILSMRINNAKSEEERKNLIQIRNNSTLEEQAKKLDIGLKEKGIQPHDSWWTRKLQDVLFNPYDKQRVTNYLNKQKNN